MDRIRQFAIVFVLAGMGFFASHPARGHTFSITVVDALLRQDGTYRIDVTVDIDPIALEVPSSTDANEVVAALRTMSPEEFQRSIERAKTTLVHRVRIRFDGKEVEPEVSFPDHGAEKTNATHATILGITARLTGKIPEGAQEFVFGCSRTFHLVHLTIRDEVTGAKTDQMLGPSEDSRPYLLGKGSIPSTTAQTAWRYLVLGFKHILPKGLDHILFVLGLFLLSARLSPLLWQITAFTIAHSITLALSMYDVISLPSTLVETTIALSISYVAFENTLTSKLHPWRPAIVFLFGLLHGLGFASVLREMGLERDRFVTALVSFNVGVEVGQLTVVLIAFLLIGWFRRKTWYRRAIVIPASVLIGLVGLYWAVTRAFGVET